MKTEQTIAFGIYKNGELIGFRADSFGSIRPYPKFYSYSESQVETVVKNTRYIAGEHRAGREHFMVGVLGKLNGEAAALLGNSLEADQQQQQALGEFELRVIPFPQITNSMDYRQMPSAETFGAWVAAGLAEPLEGYMI